MDQLLVEPLSELFILHTVEFLLSGLSILHTVEPLYLDSS